MLQSIQKNRPLRKRTVLHPRDIDKTSPTLIVSIQNTESFVENANEFMIPFILIHPISVFSTLI